MSWTAHESIIIINMDKKFSRIGVIINKGKKKKLMDTLLKRDKI